MMTGNQQKKSVRIIYIILLAMVEFWFIRVERTALAALVMVLYMTRYAARIKRNETPLRMIKTETEYSQPAGLSLDS